jgi:uncharacterized protein
MIHFWKRLTTSPAAVRVLPFALFLVLTFCQGKLGAASAYWIYGLKTLVGLALILAVWPFIGEMRWAFSWAGVGVGVAVFGIWVGLDGWYPDFTSLLAAWTGPVGKWLGLKPSGAEALALWNPLAAFGADSPLAWGVISVRILGSSLVVPPLEEVFYRSFLYRYIVQPEFQTVSLGRFHGGAFLLTAAVFGLAHQQWLAGILCAFAYQGLVVWKGRLGDAMLAHAVTNFLLGLWVVWRGAWHFW